MKRWCCLVVVIAIASLSGRPLHAQPRTGPTQAVQFRLGGFFPEGDSSFWEENELVFTQETSDFDEFTVGFTFVAPVSNHVEVGFGVDFYDDTVRSAYSGFVDQDGLPILHDASLEMVPMMVDVRLVPGGRLAVRGARGRYKALKPAVYLGGGVGLNYWRYEEIGDFLDRDFDPPVIFFDRFQDDGFAFAAYALAGVELPLGPRSGLIFEGRYLWSDDELGGDYAGFGTLDLSGASFYGGFAFHF